MAHHREHAHAAVYRWQGPGPWRCLNPEPLRALPYALCLTAEGELLAGLGDGRILTSGNGGESWRPAPLRAGGILALGAIPPS